MKSGTEKILPIVLVGIITVVTCCTGSAFAHDSYLLGYSQWKISEHSVRGVLLLDPALLNEMGWKRGQATFLFFT